MHCCCPPLICSTRLLLKEENSTASRAGEPQRRNRLPQERRPEVHSKIKKEMRIRRVRFTTEKNVEPLPAIG